jgi:hypothetical protein
MKVVRIGIAALLTLSVSGVPAFAGELRESAAKAVTAAAKADAQETPMTRTGASKPMVLAGGALFAGGMAYGLFEFINNGNGGYSEFGEASATNAKKGALGLSLAFAGGTMMLLGRHGKSMPSLTFGAKGVGVAKKVTW